jgi:hypothetical protein
MLLPESEARAQSQRIQVEIKPVLAEGQAFDKRVKLRVENYDECLGWYPSGSITLALHQLPLLEPAIGEVRSCNVADESVADKTIPVPGLAAGSDN